MADCNNLIANMCGGRGVVMPETSCKSLRLEGVDDVTINQGIGIDLADGVHAYDGDGNEIEVVIDPSEIAKCDVGVHSVKYTAVGKADTMRPTLCGTDAIHTSEDCEDLTSIEAVRTVTIEQIDPPTISGASDAIVPSGTNFNPMDGVSAIDGNGNSVDVEFEGDYPASASGEIATFNNESSKPLRSLKVTLEPIQDLNGYDKPWVGGAGKNLFNRENTTSGKYLKADGGLGASSGWSFSDYIAVPGGTTMHFNPNSATGNSAKTWFYDSDKVGISYIESGEQTFTTPSNCKYMRFSFRETSTDIQLELGSTATSYEPYENVCPISGHTEVVTNVVGKNLANLSAVTDGTVMGESVAVSGPGNYPAAHMSLT